MKNKFGRELKKEKIEYGYDVEFEIESYLRYQGANFSKSFNAHTYLLMTKALDYFDPARTNDGNLSETLSKATCQFLVISFKSDWRFPSERSKEIVDALIHAEKKVSYLDIDSIQGHDSFLMKNDRYENAINSFLSQMFKINDWISRDSKVLDLGCGDGSLLNDLRKEKSASGLGIEIDAEKIKSCLKKGISVIEQDIDSGLENFGNQSFDYVVMSQSIQALKKPEVALEEIVRIGKECIVSIPNFANIKCRLQLFLRDKCRFQMLCLTIGTQRQIYIFALWRILKNFVRNLISKLLRGNFQK